MCSIPGLPQVGSSTTVHITRVNLTPHTVLVEFGGNLNYMQENSEVWQQLKDIEVPRKRQHAFEGKPGEICLVYEDRTWHRARIISKTEYEYNVFLIDDGKSLWTTSEVLTKCPRNLCGLAPKVELCILTYVSPLCLESAWSAAASKFIRSLCGKNISGCVQDVIMPSRIILLDVPSISKQMYEFGFARNMPSKNFKILVMYSLHLPRSPFVQTDLLTTNGQQEHASNSDKLCQYLYPELSPGTIEIVTVTQVVHPLKIYCKLRVFSQELKKLSDQLHDHYEDAFSAQIPVPLCDGSPCATKGSDGKWYRSVLQQNDISDVVKVFHVDYGIGDFVKLSNIRPLSARFFHLPVVTYGCSLHGVIDKGVGWRTDQIDYLKSVILDQILVANFEHYSVNEGVYYITLYGNDNVNVNQTFGHKEHCLSVNEKICGDQTLDTLNKVTYGNMPGRNESLQSFYAAHLTECSSSVEDVNVVRPSKAEGNLQSTKGDYPLNAAATSSLQTDAYADSPPKIKVGAKMKVHITCVESVNQFYGHFAQNTDAVTKMTKDIQQLCRRRPQSKFSISLKMMCLAKFSDGLWHRGQIESMHPKILVQFVDYGDLVVVDKSDILPFPPNMNAIASLPIQAVQFELFNVTLPEKCELNEWFKNYATDCIFNVVVKPSSSGKLSVEMYDDKTNLNLKIKDLWSKTKRNESNNTKGIVKTRGFKETSEGMEFRAARNNFSTTSQAYERTSKPVGQARTEQNFQSITGYNNSTGNNIARPNVLQQQVMAYPKLTELPLRTINVGYASDVYVSHFNSPSNFFVQLTTDEDEIFSLLEKLNSSSISDAQVELNLLQSGDLVRAEYPDDGAWYRAVVQNKRDGMVQVQFIDFGNEVTLLPPKIKQLDKQFLSTPRLSIQCMLEDGKRRGKRDWTQEEIMTFKEAAGENGEKKIQCKFIQEDANCWLVSLKHQEEPFFTVKSDAQSESQINDTKNTQPLTFKKPAVTPGQTVEAYASSIVGPNYFWCQFKNAEILDTISLLAQEIGNSSQTKAIQPDQLRQGGICLARFSDQLWYRAQVIHTHEKVSVLFIDYGNESEIDFNYIKALPTKLLESPPQAFLCQLEVLGSVDGTWSDTAADKFFEILVDEPLKVIVQNMVVTPDPPMCPQYCVLVECKGLIVNDLMKDYLSDPKPQVSSKVTMAKTTAGKDNFGVTNSEAVQKNKTPNLNSSTIPSSYNVNNSAALITGVNMMDPELSMQSLPRSVDLPSRVIQPGTMSEVYISHFNNLRSFYVQLKEDENTLFSLTELLNSHQPSEKDEMHGFSVQQGSLVKAMFPEDDSWYRAVVKGAPENDMVFVEFIDFGNEAMVSSLKICRLDEHLLSYPRFSIPCSYSLSDQVKEMKERELLFKEVLGGAGENTLSCSFIKKEDITWEVTMTPCEGTSDSLREKWDSLDLKALSVVTKPVKETLNFLFKKPDVSLGQTIEAFASCIVGPDYFWCQFSNSEILDHITQVAQEYGNSSETQPILLDNLDPGSPCLARFCDDQMWYRAQVIKKCTNTVSVLFVDFGNESENSEGYVKALPCDLLESPLQAFLCRLEEFNASEGSWDSEATDNFYELLVDKPLKVSVQCIDDSVEPNSPPYYVKVESSQCLVNELMTKFWINCTQHDQNSAEVIDSCEKDVESAPVDQSVSEDKTSECLAISTENNHTSEPLCPELHGANPLMENCNLHNVPENEVDEKIVGGDVIDTTTNSDVAANDPANSDLEIQKVCHEPDGDSVVSAEQVQLHTEESKEDGEDSRSHNDLPLMPNRSSDWVARLEKQMLPMVCTEDSCDSKCVFK
ncbi:tudor domain-containing 6-like [Danio aesculapii]|uniref:tudor domain-containing 6-like n=1 Tax=Danio aesculapii TaxID=1142201 RepID=UPI0024C04505|nr:tudor domain-containing 6-like [Danio aesculapii]